MEMTNKLKFLLITTCALLYFIGTSSGFYLKENEDIEDNYSTTDTSTILDNSSELEITTSSNRFLEDNNEKTTISLQTVTTDHSLVMNKIIENVHNITTLRAGKSLEKNITIDLPENNDEIIKDQLKELNDSPTTEISIQTYTESTKPAAEELSTTSTVNEKKISKEINSTNNEENSISSNENIVRKTENFIVPKPEKHVEIQKITTGEEIEESIKKAVRDEIRSETPLDQNTLDVLESIPDEELRESVAKDILGDDYLQHAEFKENLNGRSSNVKYETIGSDSLKSELSAGILSKNKEKENFQTASFDMTDKNSNKPSYTLNKVLKGLEQKSEDSSVSSNIEENSETTEYISDSTTTTSEENESDEEVITESTNEKPNSSDVNLRNVQSSREGRAMDLSNSISQVHNFFVQEEEEKVSDVNNDHPTTILPDIILSQNKDSEISTENVENNETSTDTPILENENENIVEGRNAVDSAEIDEHEISTIDTNTLLNSESVTEHVLIHDTEHVNITPGSLEEKFQILSQEGELKHLNSENIFNKNNIGQEETVVPEVSLEDIRDVVQNQSFVVPSVAIAETDITTVQPEQNDNKESENNVINTEKLNEQIEETTTLSEQIQSEIEMTTFLPMNVEIKERLIDNKETSASDSSESKSSEEASEKEIVKMKNKNEKSDSSEESSSEEDDDEKKEDSKISLKPKGRSFSVDSQPKESNISNDISTSSILSEESEDSEHMVMKKANAESEDENNVTPTSPPSTTENVKKIPIVLNPRLKILLPHDETERIPKLTFETTTLLPMKIFKSHPLEPVRTDDIPNETNFEPRLLEDIPQQQEQLPEEQSEQQKSQEQIQELLKTESTTRLIGETFTETVELTKEVNRNMNLFLDPFETNRTSTTQNIENNSIASDEIMAASSIAEALPNQHLKRSESSLNTTLVILICVSIVVLIIAVLIVTFFRFRTPQGVLDIEMQEQRHGKQRNSIDDNDDDVDNDLSRQNSNYHCCKKITRKGGSNATSSSTDGGSIGVGDCNCFDSSSHSASCSLITTATVSSKSSISIVKRSISNSSRSNTSIKSELASAKLFNTNDETTKLMLTQQQNDIDDHDNDDDKQIKQIPTETCKLIPKNEKSQQNISDSSDNNDGNNIDSL